MPLLLCLIKAWLIGVAIAAPVGPISMICIRKSIELGFPGAIAFSFGAALADAVYAFIAALGLTAISYFLLEKAILIKLIGGIFLLYLAYSEVASHTKNSPAPLDKNKRLGRLCVDVFFLTLTSPMTILSFIGIFASIGDGLNSLAESLAMVVGIFLGSLSWTLFLGAIIVKIKHRLPETWLLRIRYLSALFIGGFGVWAVLSSSIAIW